MNGCRASNFIPRALYNAFSKNVALVAGGTALGQGLVVLASPLITRLYAPSDMGIQSVFLSILGFTTIAGALRYELAIALPKDDDTAANLLGVSFLIISALAVIFGLGLAIVGPRTALAARLGLSEIGGMIWLLPFAFFLMSGYQALSFWMIRQRRFSNIAKTKVGQGAVQLVTQVTMGIAHQGAFGLLFGEVLARFAASSSLVWSARANHKDLFRQLSWRGMWNVARHYRRYPFLLTPAALLNVAATQGVPLVLVYYYAPKTAGLYALCYWIMGLPAGLIGTAVGQVYLAELTKTRAEGIQRLRKIFIDTGRKLLVFGGVPIAVLGLAGPLVFPYVFGREWEDAGRYTRLMVPMFVAGFVVSPLTNTVLFIEREGFQLVWDFFRVVLSLGALIIVSAITSSATLAITAYSISMTVAYVVLYFSILKLMRGEEACLAR